MTDDQKTIESLTAEIDTLRERLAEIERLKETNHRSREKLHLMVEGTSASVADDFFHKLTECLASALDVEFAFVSVTANSSMDSFRLLSFYTKDCHAENFVYDVSGTPCEDVLAREMTCYPTGVREKFSENEWFRDSGVESYLAVPLFDSTGSPVGHLGVMDTKPMEDTDESGSILKVFASRVTTELERKRAEEELRESQRMLTTLMSNLPGMAYRCGNTLDWPFEFVSDGCRALTGYPPEELVCGGGVSYGTDIIHPEDREKVWDEVQTALKEGHPFKIVYRIRTSKGKEKWVWEQGRGVYSPDGELIALEGLIADITERKEAERRIERLAHYDTITDLPNRALFFDRLRHAMKYANRNDKNLALFFLDLDNFKEVNDSLGHEAGDKLLKQAAGRIRRCVRGSDTVARIGGDEFTVILHDVSGAEAASFVARKVLKEISAPIFIDEIELVVSASIGVSIYPTDAGDEDTLVRHADTAMYVAKKLGKNRYQFYSDSDGESQRMVKN